ncbi:MAG: hypothetical protein KDK99_01680 [Verrucomicrobiales bacterium]|nr:hypothetical protein [Verrucomicrobiales bacterium]
MGNERNGMIVFQEGVSIKEVARAFDCLCDRFGMVLSTFFDTVEPGVRIVSRCREIRRKASFSEAVQWIEAQPENERWSPSFEIFDAKKRYSYGVWIASGDCGGEIKSINLSAKLIGGYPNLHQGVVAEARKTWKGGEEPCAEDVRELEHQDYHFFYTAFNGLPGVEWITIGNDFDGGCAFWMKRGNVSPEGEPILGDRIPFLEEWCAKHDPEFWQGGRSLEGPAFHGMVLFPWYTRDKVYGPTPWVGW